MVVHLPVRALEPLTSEPGDYEDRGLYVGVCDATGCTV